MTAITMIHDYATTPERLWAVATDFDCLKQVVSGMLAFRGLPEGPIGEGLTIRAEVSLFGLTPWAPWTMEILSFDPERRVLQSHEHGGAVRRWDHRVTVEPSPRGARLTDVVAIDAGWLTPLYAAWGRVMMAGRHKPRLKLLGLGAGDGERISA